MKTVALAGNPNVGKTTLFNALTGLKQHTGNWTGKTVELAQGVYDKRFRMVDLPGTYSLYSRSPEEEIAREYINSGEADMILAVCDAATLERNLTLVFQILEMTPNVILVLNMWDEAQKYGVSVDKQKLSKLLHIPVISCTANRKKGIKEVTLALDGESYGNMNPAPLFILRTAKVENITPIGMNKHLKLTLSKDGKSITALYFNKTPDDFGIMEGYTVDVAFNLEINEFRGSRSVQMNVRDMKISGSTAEFINRQAKDYLRAIATFTVSKDNLPDMQAFRSAFIYLRSAAKQGKELDVGKAAVDISHEFSISVTPCMLNIMLDVFAEMGLVEFERTTLNDIEFILPDVSGKVNLESSKLLTKLKNSSY